MAASEFWPNGARLAITISLMFESGGEVRPDSGALGPLFPIPMPLEIPDLPTETYFQYGYLEGIPRLLDLFDRFRGRNGAAGSGSDFSSRRSAPVKTRTTPLLAAAAGVSHRAAYEHDV